MEDRELCNFPTTGIRALVIRIRIFLVCSVVAALTDLPHQKRIFLKPFFFFLSIFRRGYYLSVVPVCQQRCSNTRWFA